MFLGSHSSINSKRALMFKVNADETKIINMLKVSSLVFFPFLSCFWLEKQHFQNT